MRMQTHLQDFRAALSAKRAQDQSPSLGQSSLVNSLEPYSAHGFVVVVFPGEHLTVGVVSTSIARQKKAENHRCEQDVSILLKEWTWLHILQSVVLASISRTEMHQKKKKKKNPITKSHQIQQESVYLRENRCIFEHLISFSLVQGVHLRLESCLWERPVICAAVHMSITTQFHFACKQALSKQNLSFT